MSLSVKDSESRIVIRTPWWVVLGGCLILLLGIPCLGAGLMVALRGGEEFIVLGEKLSVAFLFIIPGLALVWWGTSLVSRRTKVIFNSPPRYITVIRGHISPFLWFLRTKRISNEEARTVSFCSVERTRGNSGSITVYQIKVLMKSGKELTLHESYYQPEEARRLTEIIREFAYQDSLVSDSKL